MKTGCRRGSFSGVCNAPVSSGFSPVSFALYARSPLFCNPGNTFGAPQGKMLKWQGKPEPEGTENTGQVRKEQDCFGRRRRFFFPEKPLAFSSAFHPFNCFSAYPQVRGEAAAFLYCPVVFFPSVRPSLSFDGAALRRPVRSAFSGGAPGDPEGQNTMRTTKKGGGKK